MFYNTDINVDRYVALLIQNYRISYFLVNYNFVLIFTAASTPFVLTVVTDGDETNDIGNRGFSLTYTQQPC